MFFFGGAAAAYMKFQVLQIHFFEVWTKIAGDITKESWFSHHPIFDNLGFSSGLEKSKVPLRNYCYTITTPSQAF